MAQSAFPGFAPLRPRSMLFTLYGDYAYPRGIDLWLGSLVALGKRLGISEVAVRSAVARLAADDWIIVRKEGNRSHYALSDAGRRLIEEGTQRIYRGHAASWDGTWCMLTYSIPETKRGHRDRLRKELAWLGFGPLGGGTWLSPHDVARQARALARRHDVEDFARIFLARLSGPGSNADLVRQCWDLSAIAEQYDAFIRHYAPLHSRDARRRRNGSLPDAEAFAHRFALTHDFRRFPFIDPDLPASLLPRDWAGARARELFGKHHALLTSGALRYFNSIAALGARPN